MYCCVREVFPKPSCQYVAYSNHLRAHIPTLGAPIMTTLRFWTCGLMIDDGYGEFVDGIQFCDLARRSDTIQGLMWNLERARKVPLRAELDGQKIGSSDRSWVLSRQSSELGVQRV